MILVRIFKESLYIPWKYLLANGRLEVVKHESKIFNIRKGNGSNTDDTVTIYDVARREFQWQLSVIVVMATKNVQKVLEELLIALTIFNTQLLVVWQTNIATTVEVLSFQISNTYFAALGSGDIAEMYKYNIVLASDEDDEKSSRIKHTFSKQVDGVIFMGYHLTEKIRSEFSRSYSCRSCRNSGCWTNFQALAFIDYRILLQMLFVWNMQKKRLPLWVGPLVDEALKNEPKTRCA